MVAVDVRDDKMNGVVVEGDGLHEDGSPLLCCWCMGELARGGDDVVDDRVDGVNKARGAQIHWGHSLERVLTPSEYHIPRYPAIGGVTDWYQSQFLNHGRASWGPDMRRYRWRHSASHRYGYDWTPMHHYPTIYSDYIPSLEEPQTPPVPQDEDEREPMFIQAHDPDYVPEPIYPEYIPLEDEHVFPVEEQPLPPVDSPTAESPGYVAESDPEEDPKEYEDDETEDALVDYPIDGGDNGDDDDGDSSRISADSAVVVPIVEPVSPPEGTKPVIPPPSTDISTTRARITIQIMRDGDSSTARPTGGRGIDNGFVSTVDAEARRHGISEVGQIMAPTTRRGQNTPTSNTNPNNMTPESVQAMIDQALLQNFIIRTKATVHTRITKGTCKLRALVSTLTSCIPTFEFHRNVKGVGRF
ncbi:hypothetical protein Tco_1203195 [Tanacetum coccineum]